MTIVVLGYIFSRFPFHRSSESFYLEYNVLEALSTCPSGKLYKPFEFSVVGQLFLRALSILSGWSHGE